MADIGALTFKIGADVAELKQRMAEAQGVVETAMQGASKAAAMAKTALGAIGVGLSFAAIKSGIDSAISSMDELRQMSLRTGVAVEQLSAFKGIAKLSGTDMDTVAAMIGKLDKSLLEFARSGAGKSAEAFKALGISSAEAKNALEQGDITGIVTKLSQELTKNGVSALSVAYAQEVMGKSAAQVMPFMVELASTGQLNTRVTTEQAEAAHQYNVTLIRLRAGSAQVQMQLAQALLPTMNDIATAMLGAKGQTGGLAGELKRLREEGTIDDWAQKTVIGVSYVIDIFRNAGKAVTDWAGVFATTASAAGEVWKGWAVSLVNPIKGFGMIKDAAGQYATEMVQRRDKMLADTAYGFKTVEAMEKAFASRKAVTAPKPVAMPEIALKPERAPTAEARTPYERELEVLTRAEIQVQHLTKLGEERQKILMGELGVLAPAQIAEIERRAENIDRIREEAAVAKETMEARLKMMVFADNEAEKARKAKEAETKQMESLRDKYIDMADPLEKYRKQLLEIDKLAEKGMLTQAQALEAAWKVNEEMDKAAGIGVKAAEKQDEVWKQLGLTFESAFEKAVAGGAKFRDVLAGLAQDVAKIILRKTVTEPLGNLASGILGKVDWGQMLGSVFGARAEGGPVRAGAPYLVGERGPELMVPSMSGTVVPNDALARLFGAFAEGGRPPVGLPSLVGERGPELFVPDVAGTVIPNKDLRRMGGAAPSITIVQHMSFGSDVDRTTLTAWGKEIKRNTIATVADLARRGGNFSAALG